MDTNRKKNKRYTLRDKENILKVFYKGGDNRQIVIAKKTNCELSYVDKILTKHLKEKK